jgi:predicted lipoprotein with Yx(FWY)xxD motif
MLCKPSTGRRRLRRRHRSLLAGGPLLLAVGAMFLAACGGGSSNHSSTATQPAPTAQPSAAPARAHASSPSSTSTGPTVITVHSAKFGMILADAKGLPLYTATGDTPTRSGCIGTCLKLWPPLLLPAGQAQPTPGPGVTGLATFRRPEGIQVTYHGRPLYTWIKDTSPGQVTGQGVVDSGGTWYVASLAAAATNPSAATPSTPGTPSTAAPPATIIPASPPPMTTSPAPTHAPVTRASTPPMVSRPTVTHAPTTPATTPPTTAPSTTAPGGGVSY